MSNTHLSTFLPDLSIFEEKIAAFNRKEISVADYKGFSGGFGSYAQRGGEKHMLRLRMPGGCISKNKLKFIAESCEKYNISMLKLTTCQSVQMHNLDAKDVPVLMKGAWEAGMISRGGGGDFPRNVMASPLSGVQANEYFDVMPYASAAGNYLMNFIQGPKFPRKLKVCFSNSPANVTHATFRDLGFVAKENKTFDVYCAGGLGNKPLLGVCMATDVSPDKILFYIKAMVDTFVTYGNYENRAKARTRFLQESLGIDGLKKSYLEKLEEAFKDSSLELTIPETIIDKSGDGTTIDHPRAIPQSQNGLYAVSYHPISGKLAPSMTRKLYEAIKNMDDVSLRVSPDESLFIINCTASEAQTLIDLTADGSNTLFETSLCCVGATTCQVGLGDSPALLEACIETVRKDHFADGVLPRIQISGCPSSCAAHQVAPIGFRGGMKPTPEGPKPAFAIFINGCETQGKESISNMGKSMLTTDIPLFLVELGHMISDANVTYETWLPTHQSDLDALIEKYTS